MKSCLPPQTLLNIFQQCSVLKWLSACLVSCSPYVACPAKPALHQGLYWLCRGRIVRGLYWPEQRRPILAVPVTGHPPRLAPCEPFHPHGSDLPARVLCVPAPPLADTCRDSCLHLLASLASVCVLLSYMVCVPAQARV